ncbi:MAG: AraC family transcriptional regulator [Bacteroidota bacterium]
MTWSDSNHPLVSYPGITPEIIIPLSGHLEFQYLNQKFYTSKSVLFSFIHGNVITFLNSASRFAVITFKSRALASLLPFMTISSSDHIQNPVVEANLIFGKRIDELQQSLLHKSSIEIGEEIEGWLYGLYNESQEGFVANLVEDLSDDFTVKSIMDLTRYSYSTIERRLKSETGITPKRFLSLRRYKSALAEMILSQNTDWMYYVAKYGYHDQSHFIKEVIKFTGLSPSKLVLQNSLLTKRPETDFLTNFYNENES